MTSLESRKGGHLGFGAGFGEVVLFGDQFISTLIIVSY